MCLLHAAALVVCCILCVASVPCCALVVEYNALRMLLLIRCPLLAAHEMRQGRAFPVTSRMCSRFGRLLCGVCSMPHVVCRLVACCQWSFPNPALCVAWCTAPVACCMLDVALHVVVVRCMLLEVWRMSPARGARRLLFAACCPLRAACRLDVVCCTLRVVRCIFPVACCMSSVCYIFPNACCMWSIVCCTFSSGRLLHCCSLDRVCLPFLCCMSHVLRRMRSVVFCPPPMSPLAWCALSAACPTSHLVWHMLCVARRRLRVA